ncbi:MAG: CoA transferase [Ottowia sp.]|uniref:CaiB/BaiF CoA transferase family protein n=1 Tax=Ottowia sp. TaxID=1898956 RepID=UPI003C786CF9
MSAAAKPTNRPAPLQGVRVVDFSTLLPGPLCSLLLCEAGAEVIKVERPDSGDEMRSYVPRFADTSVNFALLNRGKRSVALDLKSPEGVEAARELIAGADVLIEQFRPGVMERLGLGHEALLSAHPQLIYCSVTAWGQNGPLANVAAHDLNFQAEAGLLGMTAGIDGMPGLPQALVGDIAGGAYPALMNILLALRARDSGAGGCHLDISMTDNLFTLMYWGLGNGFSASHWPTPGSDLVTGCTPRYQIYRTRDGKHLAAAPLEQKFWKNFLRVLDANHLLDDSADPGGVRDAVAKIVATRTANEWEQLFHGVDACVNVVRSLQEAVAHPHFRERGVFASQVSAANGDSMPALPVPVAPILRDANVGTQVSSPRLGEGNGELL